MLVAAVAVAELAGHARVQATLPTEGSWDAASSFVRARFAPGDRIVAAPSWTDPIVRAQLGDLLTLAAASAEDERGTGNLWELSIRHRQSRDESPTLEREFGHVRVRRWAPPDETPAFDFVEEIERADVEYETPEGAQACTWIRAPVGTGGLGHGPLPPRERFVCDAKRPRLWVGATVMADLDHKPRRCIWQHPSGPNPVRAKWDDVVLGEELVFFGGLDYNNARRRVKCRYALRCSSTASLRVRCAFGVKTAGPASRLTRVDGAERRTTSALKPPRPCRMRAPFVGRE